MAKAKYIGFILPALLLLSCDLYTTKDKLHTYRRIKEINDSLDVKTKVWHRLLDNAVSNRNYYLLKPCRLDIGTFLARTREEVAYMKQNSASENLIDSEETFLAAQAGAVSDVYTNFESFTELTPDENIQTQLKLVMADQSREMAGTDAMRRSLAYFSQKNELDRKLHPELYKKLDSVSKSKSAVGVKSKHKK